MYARGISALCNAIGVGDWTTRAGPLYKLYFHAARIFDARNDGQGIVALAHTWTRSDMARTHWRRQEWGRGSDGIIDGTVRRPALWARAHSWGQPSPISRVGFRIHHRSRPRPIPQ